MSKKNGTVELDKVVIRFAGDSGDGMQLTGSQFTFTSALLGNDLATFPDFPAEIRAPQGTVEGVSGFQVQIGKIDIFTPGDQADVLVAMNPAALKSNIKWIKKGGNIIVDSDYFESRNIQKAGFESNPLEDGSMDDFNVIEAPITSLTKTALEGTELDNKSIVRCKNMFALGIMYWLFDRSMDQTISFLDAKFKKKPVLAEANKKALHAGYNYAITIEALPSAYNVPAAVIEKGTYRHISGNQATAWGLMAAAEKINKKLFYGSYPITPASDILHELSKYRNLGVIPLQAEDEIAAVCSAIGASYAGQLAATASSGPGIALKGEAIGLAIMAELPLVVIDVQRGGPSTGLPTKTEQADFNIAMFGRNSEAPCIVIAASTPANCFDFAFESARLSIEHMTPVMFLTDGYLANGSEPWKFPKMADLPEIKVPEAKMNPESFEPYLRDNEKLSRYWATPGTKGLEHRIGGLEKQDLTGNVSYDPANHENMVKLRAEKVDRVANYIPELEVIGEKSGDILLVGWGGTYGALLTATRELQAKGKKVALAHFNYLNPLPKNTEQVLGNYDKVLVCELNMGQFANYLRSTFPSLEFHQYNKVQGLPFTVTELKETIINYLK
ncbi:2-oxoacid:acceptor oxidoreductase subunit alpha [Fulvivirgaceae bacterium BMA10]|uniref:2-oxoacid:acceptor oxidoreductase subunit alpha n=1 Tax=Splendidivirga corallicola TaxID=3051826 RepID=A0ABT8KIB3_9BACT|nr:2-oxoacid:acceptor oxidoreductase subunit alpha [Fulvivirgaceae bacterium BMA10]